METLEKGAAAAAWFEEILKYDSAMSVVLATVGSWALTMLFLFVIRRFTVLEWRVFVVRITDAAIAFTICASTWPHTHKWVWAAVIGGLSPWLYKLASLLLGRFAPSLKPVISLTELAAADQAAANVPSGESQ